RYPAHLLGEHGGTRHLGVELGIGEARSERERRAADDQAKPGSPARKDQPGSRHDQGCGSQQARLLGKREISKDAAAEQDRDPKREAVGFGFQCAGNGRESECGAAQAALRLVSPMPGGMLVPARHRRCLCPDLSPSLCYISQALAGLPKGCPAPELTFRAVREKPIPRYDQALETSA